MSGEVTDLYRQRLGRYQAAIAMETPDRIPLSFSVGCGAKVTGHNYQRQHFMYEPELFLEVLLELANMYPQLDTMHPGVQWAPFWDAVNSRMYRVPGRDISPDSIHQFEEKEYMKEDEYRLFIDDPIGYRMNYYLPRVLGELDEKGPIRSHVAFLKAGLAHMMFASMSSDIRQQLVKKAGMPVAFKGSYLAPFDYLSDFYRGLNGIMKDMFRQPENVIEACEALLPYMVRRAMTTADPNKEYPIFNPTHKPCFMSPKQFDTFYWPTYKKGLLMLIEAGWKVRIFLEGDWSPHWHHLAELPKGSVICDVDNEADIFEAKKAFGQKQCITGGIPTDMLILGDPEDIRARVKHLCETVGREGGWIPNGPGHIPENTKPENFKALVEATLEYGRYHDGPPPEPRTFSGSSFPAENFAPNVITPWEVVKKENGWEVPGDEKLIKKYWDKLEQMAYDMIMSL